MAADLFSTLLYTLERKRAQRDAQTALSQQAAWNTANVAGQMAARDVEERRLREKEAERAGATAGAAGQPGPQYTDPRMQQLAQLGANAALAAQEEERRQAQALELQRTFQVGEADKDRDLALALANMGWDARGGIAAGQNAARIAAAGRRAAGAGLDPAMVNLEKTARVIQNQLASKLKLLNLNPMTRWEAVGDPEVRQLGQQLDAVKAAMAGRANVNMPLTSSPAPMQSQGQGAQTGDPDEEAFVLDTLRRGGS